MGYKNLRRCLEALSRKGDLKIIETELDPDLEIPLIQRLAFRKKAPALLFKRPKNTPFPLLANLFGTKERVRFIFQDFFKTWERLTRICAHPPSALKDPLFWAYLARRGWSIRPKKTKKGPILYGECRISSLPYLRSWPKDGGAYITLPQVYTEDPLKKGFAHSNLGMYRIQIRGNDYLLDKEIGLHYQIHRGIAAHHQRAISRGIPLRVNIFVGGPPAMTLAAVMPLPEGIPEVYFACLVAGERIGFIPRKGNLPILAEADFCITGEVRGRETKEEGPFGDHLGYYSLRHPFPVIKVDRVYHRIGAIWPFTTVGRPPQEDSLLGEVVHEIVAPFVDKVFKGIVEIHAVDAAGVHPLLLALGKERYVPFAPERRPQEIITCALQLLGSTQTSLSKYVLIAAIEDNPSLSTRDIPGFFHHILSRIVFERDLHFITRTTMDTLDYSGISLNQGSKVIITVAGEKKRELSHQPPVLSLPYPFKNPRVFAPGILLIEGPVHRGKRDEKDPLISQLTKHLPHSLSQKFPLVVIVDHVEFTSKNWENFLWTTFTRSDPATDIYGTGEFTHLKHWGCNGPLIIDARLKAYHAPPLEEDPEVLKKVLEMGRRGGELYGII